MSYVVKLRKRKNCSKIFDIVAAEKHAVFSRNALFLGSLDPIKKSFQINDEKLQEIIKNGSKISKKLYFRLKSFGGINYLSEKNIK